MSKRLVTILLASSVGAAALPASAADPTVIYRATPSVVVQASEATSLPLSIETRNADPLAYGAPWSLSFSAKDGKAPFTATLTGVQPPKVTVANDGASVVFSGSAYEGAWGPFTAKIVDSSVPPVAVEASASVVVSPAAQPLSLPQPASSSLVATDGVWNLSLQASGGKAPYVYSATGLPTGVSGALSGSSYVVSGTSAAGTYPDIKATAVDATGRQVETQAFAVVAQPAGSKFVTWGGARGTTMKRLSGNLDFVKFGSQADESWGLTASGSIYRWTGDAIDASPPVLTGYTDYDESIQIQCGISAGGTYCWGLNTNGALGHAGGTVPTRISNDPGLSKIMPSQYGSCGLKSDGEAWCWGTYKMSGNGLTGVKYTTPQKVVGGRKFSTLAVGQTAVCGVDTTNALWCWGDNLNGNLAAPTPSDSSTPLQVAAGTSFKDVATSGFGMCALKSDGAVLCWGSNSYGQMGNGTTTNTTSPVASFGSHAFASLTSGNNRMCGLKVNGEIWCAGRNLQDSLGNASVTAAQSLTPVKVSLPAKAVQMWSPSYRTTGVTLAKTE